jgi:hypothetical protein
MLVVMMVMVLVFSRVERVRKLEISGILLN